MKLDEGSIWKSLCKARASARTHMHASIYWCSVYLPGQHPVTMDIGVSLGLSEEARAGRLCPVSNFVVSRRPADTPPNFFLVSVLSHMSESTAAAAHDGVHCGMCCAGAPADSRRL